MGFDPRRSLQIALLGAALSSAAGASFAQSAADRETARTLMRQGDAAFETGDYRGAAKAYEAAHGIMKVPSTGVALARAQAELGKLLEARDTALAVTRLPTQAGEPSVFTEARASAQELAESLEPRIPSLTLTVEGAPADKVKVAIDDVQLPGELLGVPRKLNPGRHVATASAPGFSDALVEVDLKESVSEVLTLRLEPSGVPTTESWAGAKAEPTESLAADQPAPQLSPLVYVGFGVGAAGIIAGSVIGVMSLSKASSAKDQCIDNRCSEAARDDIDSSKNLATFSNVGFGVGVVGIGVGVYGLLSSGGSREKRAAAKARRFEPVLASRFAGVRGSF